MNPRITAKAKRSAHGGKGLILFCVMFSLVVSIGQRAVGEEVVRRLAPHQAESGLVTESEMDLAREWVTALSRSGGPAEWLDGWLSSSVPFSFACAGKDSGSFLSAWTFEVKPVEATGAWECRRLCWTNRRTKLEVVCELKQYSQFPAVEWVLTFKNGGTEDTPVIEDVQALSLSLQHGRDGGAYTVHGAEGGRSLPDDMMPFAWQSSEGSDGGTFQLGGSTSSNKHLPFWNIETPENRGVMVGIGWTGHWQAKMAVTNNHMLAQAGMNATHFILHPNEQVRSPRVLLVFWEGQRLHGHNMLRQLLHQQYVHPVKGEPQKPLATVNTCFTYHGRGGYLTQATVETLLPLVEPFGEIGAEAWVIDAGWYQTGDNWTQWKSFEIDRERYPNGFRSLSEPLAKAGIPFGLWFANEWMGPFYDPDNRAAFLAFVDRYAEEELMTMYRQDGGAHYPDTDANRVGINEIKHYEGLYEIWDQIIARHPGMIMEGCSGGGRRIDLETIQRFSWIQKSDRWFDTESDQCSVYGGNLYLPGGVLNLPTQAVDDYGCWSSFAGQLCLAWHPLDDDFPMEKARRQVELYKQIRHLLCGDYYPITKCSLEEPWIGFQFHRRDLDEGVVMLFRRRSPYSAMDVTLRGLNPQAKYELDFKGSGEKRVYTGAQLKSALGIRIPEAPAAEMVIYRRAVN